MHVDLPMYETACAMYFFNNDRFLNASYLMCFLVPSLFVPTPEAGYKWNSMSRQGVGQPYQLWRAVFLCIFI